MRDFKRLVTDPPAGICATPEEDDILSWHGVIFGPEDTPWEGGTFKVTLQFSEEYPNKAPVVKFVSRMFHPNSLFSSFPSSFPFPCIPPHPLTLSPVSSLACCSLPEREHLPGHPAEPVEPDLRRVGHPHEHPVAAVGPQPREPRQWGGGAPLHRKQARVRPPGARGGGAVVEGRRVSEPLHPPCVCL